VVRFREALHAILTADLHRTTPPSPAVASLNRVLAEADASRRLVWDKRRFVWRDGDPAGGPTAPLWPIARAAAALLTSEERAWVRECGETTCRWLFLDRSRNHSRRWCDMKSCGNRQKARRFHARHQKRHQK
jgi:predicted RNA-binding Zn ribbon-like protein